MHDAHWGYEGDVGPRHWATLAPEYGACAGAAQSPIDLGDPTVPASSAATFDYRPGGAALRHTGHALQLDYEAGSAVVLDDGRFELKQVHFHAPSEHTIEGRSFPLEAHLVHANRLGQLAVVSVLFVAGIEGKALALLPPALPAVAGEERALRSSFDAAALLPATHAAFRYDGSLTTPPCTEGVRWVVMQHPVVATPAQLAALARASNGNHRPVQPRNARRLFE